MIYKVSYVILGGEGAGAIINELVAPEVGKEVLIGTNSYVVQEVVELMSRGDLVFLQATVEPKAEAEEKTS